MTTAMHIPVDFIIANSCLEWADVRYGFEKGFVNQEDVVKIAMHEVAQTSENRAEEIELAGLYGHEMYRVSELLEVLSSHQVQKHDSKGKWLYLFLAWLYAQKETIDDPFGAVEHVYAEFDYPVEISSFVAYMPPSDGYRPQDHSPDENRRRLYTLWHEFVSNNPFNIKTNEKKTNQ